MPPAYSGYVYKEGRHGDSVRPEDADAVVAFLKAHLYDEEVVITDGGDNMLFHASDGIDLYSGLDELGIDLQANYQEIRREIAAEATAGEGEREPWKELYDSVGLSAEEIRMRQSVKRTVKAARTVADVARLLENTYFDVFFETEDGTGAWGYFDPKGYSALVMKRGAHGGWRQDGRRFVTLQPETRVRHKSSGEDTHLFILLDPPSPESKELNRE